MASGATPDDAGAPAAQALKARLEKAYTPADLALLLNVLAKAGIPDGLDFMARQAPGALFSVCGAGAKEAFVKAVDAHLGTDAAELRAEVAGGFDPPFSHAEIAALDRLYQLNPIMLAPPAASLPARKPLSASEQAESDALMQSPPVVRYINSLQAAMTPAMDHVASLVTDALHESCPALRDQQVRSTGPSPPDAGPGPAAR